MQKVLPPSANIQTMVELWKAAFPRPIFDVGGVLFRVCGASLRVLRVHGGFARVPPSD